MRVTETSHLRALRNEAERQQNYYAKRNDTGQSQVWADMADLASEAMETRGELHVSVALPISPTVTRKGAA